MDDLKFTEEDFEILINSVDYWADAGGDSLLFKQVFGSVLARGNELAQVEMEKQMKIEQEKFEQTKRDKRKKAALLKAKLIQLQQKFMNSPSEFSLSDLI